MAAVSGGRTSFFSNDGTTCSHTAAENNPTWWLVDLGVDVRITNIIFTSRSTGGKVNVKWFHSVSLCSSVIYLTNECHKKCDAMQCSAMEFFSRSLHNTRMAILITSFWPCNSKLKRLIKSAALKGNPFYQLTSNFTFTNILQIREKTATVWEYKVGINAIIANFVCM